MNKGIMLVAQEKEGMTYLFFYQTLNCLLKNAIGLL